MMVWVGRLFSLLAVLVLLAMGYFIAIGFPPEILGHDLPLKNLKKTFLLFMVFALLSILFYPDRFERLKAVKTKIEQWAQSRSAIWILTGVYALLFLWQQLSEYLALKINFIPFGFYDYMLYYFFQGKLNYTGLLHGFYHFNNILFVLAPFWKLFQNSLFLVLIYGPLAALPALPLYGIARQRFKDVKIAPFVMAFIYLNYRYLQNILEMNFSVEIFYPLFVFSAVYFALKSQWKGYYLSLFFGLCVKEDAFFYFASLAALVFFLKNGKLHAVATVLISAGYFVFLTKLFAPWTGNDVLSSSLENFGEQDGSVMNVIRLLATDPAQLVLIFLGSPAKWKTYFNLLYRFLFLPVFSPTVLLVLAPLFLLFFRSTGKVDDFVDLRFHYAGAVIPFVMIALVFGFSNLSRRVPEKWRSAFIWGVCLSLVLINGGHYRSSRFTREDLRSIEWARSIPQGANVVTHGHLLPYIGYREYNYYFARPYEKPSHRVYEAYRKADYYLIDLHVDPYPLNKDLLNQKINELKASPDYELFREDGTRFLFRRK